MFDAARMFTAVVASPGIIILPASVGPAGDQGANGTEGLDEILGDVPEAGSYRESLRAFLFGGGLGPRSGSTVCHLLDKVTFSGSILEDHSGNEPLPGSVDFYRTFCTYNIGEGFSHIPRGCIAEVLGRLEHEMVKRSWKVQVYEELRGHIDRYKVSARAALRAARLES